jgi:tetratricopeptide (TPR) repeat protein
MAEPSVFKYRAFLSYAHADGRTARSLHKALEAYPIDPAAVGRLTAIGAVPKNLRPIFLDREDFAGGHSLTDATVAALDQSAALVVLCSKVSATRPAVAEEVRLFRWRHPERPVIPVILDGTFPDNFPPPLRFEIAPDGTVTDRPVTILGPDLRKDADGRELALAKVVSGLTGLSTLDVFNRFKREQTRQARRRWAIAGVLLLSLGGFGYFFHDARQKGEVIAVRETERSQALDIARQLLGANPAAAAAPGQEQSLVAALTAIQEQAARGDGDYAKAFDLLKAGKGAEAVPLLIAAADAKKARAAKENKDAAKAYREAAAVASVAEPWRARELYIEAARLDPEDVEGLFQAGWFQQEAGKLEAAESAYRRILAIGKSGTDDRRLYWSRLGLGDIQVARGDLTTALETFRDASNLADRLAKADPGNAGWQRDLSVSYERVGDVLVAQGRLPDALTAFRDSLAIAERLAQADPGNAGWQRDLALSYGRVARIQAQSGEMEEARQGYGKARDIIARLVKLSPDNATLPKDLAYYDAQIAALD